MTRINTNVSSLTAQNTLARTNVSLQQALTRLSTGLRINAGKDDPAGLIASEALRSDITSTQKAISNTQQANQMIATADSALGQVSSLLNDIRGLVTEAANRGAMSADQIAANQLQVDSSLEALNRISQTTTFQGRRLLDGSMDFVTSWATPVAPLGGQSDVQDMQINQANLGVNPTMSVKVEVSSVAKVAQLQATVDDAVAGDSAHFDFSIGNNGTPQTLTVTAPTAGTGYNGTWVEFVEDGSTAVDHPTAQYVSSANTLKIFLNDQQSTTFADIEAAVERDTGFQVSYTNGQGTAVYNPLDEAPTGAAAVAASGKISLTDGTLITLKAATTGAAFDGNVVFDDSGIIDNGAGTHRYATAAWDNTGKILKVSVDRTNIADADQIAAAINAIAGTPFSAAVAIDGGVGYQVGADSAEGGATGSVLNYVDGGGNGLQFKSKSTGVAANDLNIEVAIGLAASVTVTSGTDIKVTVLAAAQAYTDIKAAIEASAGTANDANALVSAVAIGTDDDSGAWGPTSLTGAVDTSRAADTTVAGGANAVAVLNHAINGGTGGTGGLANDLVLQISGKLGTQVFNFEAGTSGTQVASAISRLKDATGVEAAMGTGADANHLFFNSTAFGSDAFVGVDVISEKDGSGAAATDFTDTLVLPGTSTASRRATGTDIIAKVNGMLASGKGTTLSLNSSTLALTMTLKATSLGVQFDITGGGALFQVGPDVVSNQQARLGIGSVNTASLGGASGRLYEVGSGGDAALATDPGAAASITDEVINKVTSLRGRLGAFQKSTLDTNIASLTDTVQNLTDAQSSIRDADFAAESANLTRAQILVQSGTAVLSIANKNPENVLALLR
jgi:flagellin